MKKVWEWCKTEIVLCVAILLAIMSAFLVTPDKEYIGYIDFRTLAILLCLMAIMAGLQNINFFRFIAEKMIGKVNNIRFLVLILIMLCFFSSMFITNDVALITFVPFTFIMLKMILQEKAKSLAIPVVVMQTIAANLGSMLTPIGNPQNLYLYGKANMGLWKFISLMFPYTLVAFVLLAVWCFLFPYKGTKDIHVNLETQTSISSHKRKLIIYGALFLLCIFTVAHIIPYEITLIVVTIGVLLLDKTVWKKIDYSLLFTFIGFFVFIGNMGRVPAFNQFIKNMIDGNEIGTSIVASQFMSNVPAAILLSGFTKEYELLIVGTNLGGLGTLIASMASLISYKYIVKEYKEQKGKYLLYFTVANILFLFVLLCFQFIVVGF